jgi:uncharacterized tellurite resistance protein B-like protein
MKFRINSLIPSIVRRRRTRQREEQARQRRWSYDLVLLRVQLLIAMAAVDGRIVREEVQAIDRAIEGAPLPADQRTRLQGIALQLVRTPPRIETLLEPLEAFRADPALARALVTDLARVAAVDLFADPREQALLERICEVVGVDPVAIPAPRTLQVNERPIRRAPKGFDSAAEDRIRDVVRRALEASYEADAG